MSNSNSQLRSSTDACIPIRKQGLGREEWATLLRVRTRPKCLEGNLRELTWASKPDCEITTTQKALT